MFKQLFEAALASTTIGVDAEPEAKAEANRNKERISAQIDLVKEALRLLKSVATDIDALRTPDGLFDVSGCELEFESETIEWPNLAIDADAIGNFLRQAEEAGADLPVWYMLDGQGRFHKVQAEDREHVLERFQATCPGETALVAVPANRVGELQLFGYGEDPVRCPTCGRRTDFEELPVGSMQIHVCHPCAFSFIASPDEETAATP